MMTRTISIAPIRKTLLVKAPQTRAFNVFTDSMATWWRPDHHIAKTPFVDIVIEPRTGGRWFERDKDGAECDWGRVLSWSPPARLLLAWQLDSAWKYDPDFVTEIDVQFIAEGPAETRVVFEHRGLERYGDAAESVRAMLDAPTGWGSSLAAYVTTVGPK
jgi:uncharacterized protein YndB with AHSA1/START domain